MKLANRWSGWMLVPLALLLALAGCSKKLKHDLLPNQLPEVRLTAAPVDTSGRYFYSYTVDWVGYDPDGRVDHYLYAIDPQNAARDTCRGDTCWTITRENERRLNFRSSQPAPNRPGDSRRYAEDPHTFAIKAVDDRGAEGPVVYRSFFSYTEAPDVNLLFPAPGKFANPVLTPSVRFTWGGTDNDGVFTSKPVKYKYLLMTESSVPSIEAVIFDPDSLRRYAAPTNFAGWDSTSAETTQVQFSGLAPGHRYLFIVIGFDEAGAYSPNFALEKNMLRFSVGYAATLGPQITFFNEFINYTYPGGGYCVCRAAEVDVELPAGRRITVNWFAKPPTGADIESYRWMLDGDVNDQHRRDDECCDLRRWSAKSRNVTSATLGPFPGGEEHRLYVEAADNIGLRSLGIIHFTVVQSTFEKEIGIVDDTRYQGDYRLPSGCTSRPLGAWPTAAELDTFLYARGGNTWSCYPAGTMTTPGIFSNYDFDTLGTRLGRQDLTIKLAQLGHFRHLIWLADGRSATFFKNGTDQTQPQTSLRYMSISTHVNTIGSYVKQGGLVWGAGGGIAYASQIPADDPSNNTPTTTFSNITGRNRELDAGRFMFDLPHWQSEIRVSSEPTNPKRFLGRFEAPQSPADSNSASWIPYWRLPRIIDKKGTGPADPLPPQRTTPGDFYKTTFDFEYLQKANYIIENISTDLDSVNEVSTLDTLYEVDGGGLPRDPENPNNVVMTYYHGPSVPQGFVFTGFSLWMFKRDNCEALIDFVLQQIWHLSPTPTPHGARASRMDARRAYPTAPEMARWRTPSTWKPSSPTRSRVPAPSRSGPARSPGN